MINEAHKEIERIFHIITSGPLPIVTGQRYGDRTLFPELCKKLGYKVGAEIGVRNGSFSQLFCEVGMEMWCVDPWFPVPRYDQERQDRIFAEAQQRLNPYNVHFVKKTSMDGLVDVPNDLDFIHIDGNHEFDFIMEDLIHWHPKVKSGGLVACHDYHLTGVKRAIEAYTLAWDIRPWFTLKARQITAFWVKP